MSVESAPGITCLLTHWGRDKMAATFQTTFSNAFSWIKIDEFQSRFHWGVFLRVQLTIFQHWLRQWLGADQATGHCLNQWRLVYWRIYASLCLNELTARYWQMLMYGCVITCLILMVCVHLLCDVMIGMSAIKYGDIADLSRATCHVYGGNFDVKDGINLMKSVPT